MIGGNGGAELPLKGSLKFDELVDFELTFQRLVENIPIVTYVDAIDDESSALYMSPQIEELLGYPVKEWLEDSNLFMKLLHPEDRDRIATLVKRTNRTGELFRAEYRLIARDGRVVWFRDEAIYQLSQAGQPPCYLGYMADITARKEFEIQLRETEKRYRNLVEQLPVIAYSATQKDKQRHWLYVSPKVKSLLGFRPDELRADSRLWFRQIHLEDRERVLEAEQQLLTDGIYDAHYRMLSKDGRQVRFHDKGSALEIEHNKTVRLQGVMLDVTDQFTA